MSDEVYRAIGQAASGFVEAPAGCGKTEAIVRTVAEHCSGPQLVLTHTHAGVDALRHRFREHHVASGKYHVDTIAGWCWAWVRKYPSNAGYRGPPEIPVWDQVYAAMPQLLQKDFVRQGVLNSYSGVIVDEYQDCTVPMHRLIMRLKTILPCRVLGDDLQAVFEFRGQSLVGWSDVKSDFANDLGALDTPHRWIKAANEPLGRWLLRERPAFRAGRDPDYSGSRINRRTISARDLGAELIRFTHATQGRICIIGPKSHALASRTTTTLVKNGYRVLEPNELAAMRAVVTAMADGSARQKAQAAVKFLRSAFASVPADDMSFMRRILEAQSQRPLRADRRSLCGRHSSGATPHLLLDLLDYAEKAGVSCKLNESVSALRCVLEQHLESGGELKTLYAEEIAEKKQQSRSRVYRCIGSTLLVKGLEFDHAVILRGENWQQSWGNYRDLYVAMTRGSRSTTLVDLTQ